MGYRLVEELPYGRGTLLRRNASAPDGWRLHGVYEHRDGDGYRAVIINNGLGVDAYRYDASLTGSLLRSDRHSFANVVLCAGPRWDVADGWLDKAETSFARVAAGLKPVATEEVPAERAPQILTAAVAAGFAVSAAALPHDRARVTVAAGGPLATPEDLDGLAAEYRRLGYVCDDVFDAIDRLSGMTGQDAAATHWTGPRTDADWIVTGFCFGYPPASTLAVMRS